MSGTLVIPGDATGACNVPEGYAPLTGADVRQEDAAGSIVGDTTRTDGCGTFSIRKADEASSLVAEAAGYRPIIADVAQFETTANAPTVLSTIEAGANYQIGAIQILDDGRVAFSVTDTVSNQSVLGIPKDAVHVKLDGAQVDLNDLGYGESALDAATALLVMDSSGSMGNAAFATASSQSKYEVASLAAHKFIEQKAANDQVGVLLFSSYTFPVNRAYVTDILQPVDSSGNPVDVGYPASGFTTEQLPLHFIIDTYNRYSNIWPLGTVERYFSLPDDLFINRAYPFGGGTRMYQALIEGIDSLQTAGSVRPVIVVMTDGLADDSYRFVSTVQAALDADIPIYAIGLGVNAASTQLAELASNTGGTYYKVDSVDLSDAFQSIQTGIVFQYLGALVGGVNANTATTIEVVLDYNGQQASRELMVNSDAAVSVMQSF